MKNNFNCSAVVTKLFSGVFEMGSEVSDHNVWISIADQLTGQPERITFDLVSDSNSSTWYSNEPRFQTFPYMYSDTVDKNGDIVYATILAPVNGIEPAQVWRVYSVMLGGIASLLLIVGSCCCLCLSLCVRAFAGNYKWQEVVPKKGRGAMSVPLLSPHSDDEESELPPPPSLNLEAALLRDDDENDNNQEQTTPNDLLVDNIDNNNMSNDDNNNDSHVVDVNTVVSSSSSSSISSNNDNNNNLAAAYHSSSSLPLKVAAHRKLLSDRRTHHISMFVCVPAMCLTAFAYPIAFLLLVSQLTSHFPAYTPVILAMPYVLVAMLLTTCVLTAFACVKQFWPVERRICVCCYLFAITAVVALLVIDSAFQTECWHWKE